MEIILPIILCGDGELCKYKFLSDAEKDLEAYDIHLFTVFDSLYRKIELYKKDKYNRVGFRLIDEESKHDEFIKIIKDYMSSYDIDDDIDEFIQSIPIYPNC